MFNKKKDEDFLLDDTQDQDKKSTKKIIIDIIGIIIVIAVIIGTYFLIVFREEIIAAIPIIRDENGKMVIKKDTKSKSTRAMEKLTAPVSIGSNKDTKLLKFSGKDPEVDEKGLKFTLVITPYGVRKNASSTVKIERMAIDGLEIPNHYEIKIDGDNAVTQEVLIEKTELDKYSIIRPNVLTLFVKDSENDTKGIPEMATINFNYDTPMDNHLKGLIPVDDKSDLALYFYKQETDIENTYLYFDMRNDSSSELKTLKIKKLVINDKIFDINDFEEEAYYMTEKLFYVKVPRQQIAKVNKFTISFFIIIKEDTKDERIYITKEYTHEE